MLLETERLYLRSYDWRDLDQLHAILSDSVTMKFWPAPFTLDQSQQWMRQSMEMYAVGLGRLGVFLKSDGSLSVMRIFVIQISTVRKKLI